ncbi:hypothetical protein IMZ48_00780, partial [Candidatus Bathyarchaeota archaeon]|nr:hypothetical protein [Candidatus Bathyarchaeota archaeon]
MLNWRERATFLLHRNLRNLLPLGGYKTGHHHHLHQMADMTRPAEEVRSPPATTEHTPLLHKTSENSEPAIPTDLTARLYASHFLSTWNSRVFEFGAVLYLATIFPGTLLPVSVYAIARGAAAIAFSPGVGRWVDTGDRLGVVRVSV